MSHVSIHLTNGVLGTGMVDTNVKNKWGVDRFDLEQAMMNVAMTQDDIVLLSEMAYEKDWSQDKMMNAWLGLSILLEARTLKQEEIYSKLLMLDQYRSDDGS